MELSAYFRFVAALLFVLGVIGVFALLAVVEVVPVDTKRRLVLLRRDDTEHLVMLGPNGDTVVERNIGTHFSEILGNQPPSDETLSPETTEIAIDATKDAAPTDRNTPA